MSEIQDKLFDLLYILVPLTVIVTLFFVLEKRRKK